MTNEEYWTKRAEQQLTANEKKADAVISRMMHVYTDSLHNIEADISRIYGVFMGRNSIAPGDLQAYMSKAESMQWRNSIAGYMREIERVGGRHTEQGQALWLEVEMLSAKERLTRLEALKASIYANMAKVAKIEDNLTSDLLAEVFKDDYYSNMYEFYNRDVGAVIKLMETGSVAVENKDVFSIVMQVWSGANYSQRIWHNSFNDAFTITSMVSRNMIAGQSPKRIAADLTNHLGVSRKSIERLILTETTHIKTEADIASYLAADIDKVIFHATLDARTCNRCGPHDKQIIRIDDLKEGYNKPPVHPRCRCLITPYNDYLEKYHKKYGTRTARNKSNRNIKVDYDLSYKEWYNKYVA